MHGQQRGSLQVVMKDRVSDKPRGFGFVTFVDESVADKVCEEKHELQGRQVRVQLSVVAGNNGSFCSPCTGPYICQGRCLLPSDRRQTLRASSTAAQKQESLCRWSSTSYQRRQVWLCTAKELCFTQ